MLHAVKTGFLAGFAALSLAACQSNSDVRNKAVQDVSGVTPTTDPATGTAPSDLQAATESMAPAGPATEVEFDQTTIDFGTVNEGVVVKKTFKFKNVGKEPYQISNASGSCGCTVPKWPKEPIAPGETGTIVVEFDSNGKQGDRNQKVTLTGNTTPPEMILNLNGKVTPKAESPTVTTTVQQ